MTIRLFKSSNAPNEIIVSKSNAYVEGGAFYLDLSRPLEFGRWFGVPNRWVGISVRMFVPVVHQGECAGGYVIGVERGDPGYDELRTLWRTYYPSKRSPPIEEADSIKVIADFATQFPDDCR